MDYEGSLERLEYVITTKLPNDKVPLYRLFLTVLSPAANGISVWGKQTRRPVSLTRVTFQPVGPPRPKAIAGNVLLRLTELREE